MGGDEDIDAEALCAKSLLNASNKEIKVLKITTKR